MGRTLLNRHRRTTVRAAAAFVLVALAASAAFARPQGINTPVSINGGPATQPMSAATASEIARVHADSQRYEDAALTATLSTNGKSNPNADPARPRDDAATPTQGSDASSTATATGAPQASNSIDFMRIAAALAIVVAMIVGAKLLFNRMFPGSSAPSTSRAVKILGRTPLAPRQQVLLLQIGGRVVVVGESNGSLSTLAQIEDADEVARLIGQLQEEKVQRAASFGGLFGRMQRHYDDAEAPLAAPDRPEEPIAGTTRNQASALAEEQELSQAKSDLSGLVEKVRALRSQLDP